MTHHWDELSKSLAEESLPRRESLRRIGAVLAGAVLSPLGLESAFARGPDPCKAFCRCSNKRQQNACLAACRNCNKDTSRVCGSCGSGYVCCRAPGTWEYGACIDGYCEYACVAGADYCDGICTFLFGSDASNCGACGHTCGESTPYCSAGQCFDDDCGGRDLLFDSSNCGTCGNVCPWQTYCAGGVCTGGGDGDGGGF